MRKFRVKEEHLKLLKRAYVRWEYCEFGAPAIDCKRPYGNSSVIRDIAEILGVEPAGLDGDFTNDQRAYLTQLHYDTENVLQIILATGEMKAGLYTAADSGNDWTLLNE